MREAKRRAAGRGSAQLPGASKRPAGLAALSKQAVGLCDKGHPALLSIVGTLLSRLSGPRDLLIFHFFATHYLLHFSIYGTSLSH